MKIVCEACGAKYSISDDKVRGKVFKIRCKKCSHIIVVRGTEDTGGIAVAEPHVESPQAAAPLEAVWYVVLEGEQVGPLTEPDVAARVSRGEVSGETFAWREGMADWIQVSAIAEFAGALASAPAVGPPDAESPFAPQPTAVYPPGTAESIFGDEGDLPPVTHSVRAAPARSEATEVFGAAVAMGRPSGAQDLFAPQADHGGFSAAAPTSITPPTHHAAPAPVSLSSLGAGGGFFPASSPIPSPAASGGLTSQRSENSVLFSLSNLESLAGGHSGGASSAAPSGRFASAPAPVAEGSGLIDIRSMAKMTMGKQAEASSMFGGLPMSAPELPTFSASPIAPLAPMMLPSRQTAGAPKYVWALIGLLVIALGSLTYVFYTGRGAAPAEAPVVAPAPTLAPPPAEPPTTAQPVPAAKPEAVAPEKEEPLPPRDQPIAAHERPVKKASTGSGAKRPSAEKSENSTAKADPTPHAEPAVKETPPPPAKKGSLDDLLAGAMGGTPKKPSPSPSAAIPVAAEPSKKSGPLGKGDIVKGMMGVMPKTKGCYDQFKVPGTASVTVKVDTGGRVDNATVTGKFAGTPTGDCVERAVKTAKFPPSDGLTFPYPIPLR